ncbi:MAG: hypothetical protein HOO86_12675 [Bacteroidales bacterium]|nr:hypothetical protein [Bacteroidales bacterium]
MKAIDEIANERGLRYMPAGLLIPIAARDENSISKYIGTISNVIVKSEPNNALMVEIDEMPKLNERLVIWKLKESAILYSPKQVWVHVDYKGYRKAYQKAFPNEDITGFVLDHIMNRRVARLKGFNYLRIIPISRVANSCSGNVTEKYGHEYHNTAAMKKINSESTQFIQFADLADVVKMLNIKTGGSLQDGVNEGQKYLLEIK